MVIRNPQPTACRLYRHAKLLDINPDRPAWPLIDYFDYLFTFSKAYNTLF